MINKLNKFVIVGGGTSGWCSAIALLKKIENIEVVVVDKEEDDQIGVGEATILNGFDHFMTEYCGFPELNWKIELDAVPKAGILFSDWGKEGNEIWHPFVFPMADPEQNISMVDALSHFPELNYKDYLPLYYSALDNRVDVADMGAYAWHIDCLKLIRYFEKYIKKTYPNFTHIRSTVKNINRLEDGTITSLVCDDGQTIDGDFFVDCSGFKSILKENRDTVSLKDRLFVDTAIAGHVQYADGFSHKKHAFQQYNQPWPFVECPAVEHGWIWKIPLKSRIGTGMVFNRNITDIEEAKDYFVNYWDNRIDRDKLRPIPWSPYYDRNPWHKNVVSIGLSSGFIEPLESTGVALILGGVTNFIKIIQGKYFDDFTSDLYNTQVRHVFETCVDFVSMHYNLSERNGKFWDYVRSVWKPSSYHELMANNFNSSNKSISDTRQSTMFTESNWQCWMTQLGYPLKPKVNPTKDHSNNCLKKWIDFSLQLTRTTEHTLLKDFLQNYKSTGFGTHYFSPGQKR